MLLTRARRGLIVVGNKKTLDLSDSSWKKWVEWMETEKLIVESGKKVSAKAFVSDAFSEVEAPTTVRTS